MDKKHIKRSSLRQSIDEQDQKIDHISSSIINEQSNLFSNQHHHLIYNPNIFSIPTTTTTTSTTTTSRKRSIQNNLYIHEHDQHINKRIRYEPSNHIESENQPPRRTLERQSLFIYHPREDNQNISNENTISTSFNSQLIPTYHRINPNNSLDYSSEQNFSNDLFSSNFSNENFYMFNNDSLRTSTKKSTHSKSSINNDKQLISSQLNGTNPLRTTNFLFDNKQQTMNATIMRTGNISPAHSDTSIESTSTCSSDEQQLYHNFLSFHYQPSSSRSYRERENYEQLLDLAEKLSDPNRLKKIDIEQFFSYRYKTNTTIDILSSSKQTACVICMSHFKNGQHIRVLPCQHEYHTKCIARWFTMNSSCPICRRDNFLSTC